MKHSKNWWNNKEWQRRKVTWQWQTETRHLSRLRIMGINQDSCGSFTSNTCSNCQRENGKKRTWPKTKLKYSTLTGCWNVKVSSHLDSIPPFWKFLRNLNVSQTFYFVVLCDICAMCKPPFVKAFTRLQPPMLVIVFRLHDFQTCDARVGYPSNRSWSGLVWKIVTKSSPDTSHF